MLHTEILKIKTLYLCTELKAVNAVLKANGSIGEGAKMLFSGCTVDLNGVPSPECTPKDTVDGEGKIVTKNLHGLLVLGAAGEDLLRILPDNVGGVPSRTYMTVEMGAECPIGTKVPVIGNYSSGTVKGR